MSYQITVQPATEPITTAEARSHLKMEGESYDDTYIDTLIATARAMCEKYCNRVFITQTWRQNENEFNLQIPLEVSPVISVTSVKYYDTNDTQQTLSTSNYQVDLLSDTATIYEGISAGFPAISNNVINPIEIIYVCGYGSASDVPTPIKHAIKILLTHLYENRETVNVPIGGFVTQVPMPQSVKEILSFYRVKHFG